MVRGERILPVSREGPYTRISFLRIFILVEGNRLTPLYILCHFERSEKSGFTDGLSYADPRFLATLEMTLEPISKLTCCQNQSGNFFAYSNYPPAPFASLFPQGEGWGEGSNALQLLDLTPPHPNLLPQGEGTKSIFFNNRFGHKSRDTKKSNFEIGSN